MTANDAAKYKARLEEMADQTRATADALEDEARRGVGGEAGGSLSNVPFHLGDLGTATFDQEMDATLLENEQYLRDEVLAALGRIAAGTFGTCEECGRAIAAARLDALPYVRYCVGCAGRLQSGAAVNLNAGRPRSWADVAGDTEASGGEPDVHAAGTPGGGTAVGGLAGTTVGSGGPDGADLEEAMGSGAFDVAVEEKQTSAERANEDAPGGA